MYRFRQRAKSRSVLVALNRNNKPAGTTVITVFAQINSLPGPQTESSLTDRDGDGTADHGAFDMSRHIIGTFQGVPVIEVFPSDLVERQFQVKRNIRIRILVDRNRRRCVQDEYMHQSDSNSSQLRDAMNDLFGDQMESAPDGRELNFMLIPGQICVSRYS